MKNKIKEIILREENGEKNCIKKGEERGMNNGQSFAQPQHYPHYRRQH